MTRMTVAAAKEYKVGENNNAHGSRRANERHRRWTNEKHFLTSQGSETGSYQLPETVQYSPDNKYV